MSTTLPAFMRLAIFLDEELGLFPWPEIEVALADERLPRPSEQVFSRAIEPHEPQRRALLDEQHEGNVLDDGVEECVGILELLLDALALGDVHDRAHHSHRIARRVPIGATLGRDPVNGRVRPQYSAFHVEVAGRAKQRRTLVVPPSRSSGTTCVMKLATPHVGTGDEYPKI